jgi:hypothetical protein
MTNPVPGFSVSTPYGRRGSYWSCNEDASGNGIHTGVDYAAPSGTKVVAARPGVVQHSSHGSAFGNHQVDIPCDGTRDFYAHMRSRVPHGTKVEAGDKIGEVGAEGNVTGPHLHFERHKVTSGGWSCAIITDPQPSIDYKASGGSGGGEDKDPMPKHVRGTSDAMKLNGDWQLVDWEGVSGDSKGVIAKGDPGFTFVGPYVSSLSFTVDSDADHQGQVQSRTVEGNFDGKGGAWQITQENQVVETQTSGAWTPHVDCRAQELAKGDRLRVQIRGPKGTTAKNIAVSVLYWT